MLQNSLRTFRAVPERQTNSISAWRLGDGIRHHAIDAEIPSASAIAAAIPSITRVNEVRANDWS